MLKHYLPALFLCQSLMAAETYPLHFSGTFDPGTGRVEATIEVQQSRHELRLLDFSAPEPRFSRFRGDGEIERDGQRLIWTLPPTGGRLSYSVKVDRKRGVRFDARMAEDWAILRLDNVFPAARTVGLSGAESIATMSLDGPQGWSFESRYGPVRGRISVANPDRRFDRPTGWLAAGRLGVRREWIGERRITVAGPPGHDLRRIEMIALLRWTLPELVAVFPDFPDYVLIVGAGEDMWRGGLSGPNSLYLHAQRPLISENGTSTLLHEMVHIATGPVRGPREDWIVEGLAEFYALEALHRSGGLSVERYLQAFDRLADWARRERGTLRSPSTGPHTARAALLFRDLALELDGDPGGLDPIARQLLRARSIDEHTLRTLVEEALGGPSRALDRALKAARGPRS